MSKYLEKEFDLNSDKLIDYIDELPIWSAPFGLRLLDNIRYRKNIKALDVGLGQDFL